VGNCALWRKMKKRSTAFLPEFDKFIVASRTGRRRKPDGSRVCQGTIKGYLNCRRLLLLYEERISMTLEIPTSMRLSASEFRRRKLHWDRFARKFSDFLYSKGYFDNYVSSIFKVIRAFLHHLEYRYGWPVGSILPSSCFRSEEIPALSLSATQFRTLLNNKDFLGSLTARQSISRDIFVVGCATTLRVSDLFRIRRSNLSSENGRIWLTIHSQKTGTKMQLKLPGFVEEIFGRYHFRSGRLLPRLSIVNFNRQIKKFAEIAGWTRPILKVRSQRGEPMMRNTSKTGQLTRFCDLLSSHTMRRTGISLLLQSGMPEHLVRRISGHRPGSKEFHRYVSIDQLWQDEYSEKAFLKLSQGI